MTMTQTRRKFLTTLSLAGAAGVVRAPPSQAAEGPPEITSVRITKLKLPLQSVCLAPPGNRGGAAPRRGFHRCPLCGHAGERHRGNDRARRS